jgi:hypothetical protein
LFQIEFGGKFCRHGVLPSSPIDIDAHFEIYQSNRNQRILLTIWNMTDEIEQMKLGTFDSGNVVLIVHGFGMTEKEWMYKMADALMKRDQVH